MTIDAKTKMTVVTQFINNDGTATGTLIAIQRIYVQNGKVSQQSNTNVAGIITTIKSRTPSAISKRLLPATRTSLRAFSVDGPLALRDVRMGLMSDEDIRESNRRQNEAFERAERTAQNPRPLQLDPASAKQRNEIAAALLSYYKFLTGLYIPEEALRRPPKGDQGWDYINAERFAFLGKTDAVIDLYKHIPYIAQDRAIGYQIDVETICIDYTGKDFQRDAVQKQEADSVTPGQFDGQDAPIWNRLKEPQHVALLAKPLETHRGLWIAIDIRDGKAAQLMPLNEVNEQTSWEFSNIQDLLRHLREEFMKLASLPLAPNNVVSAEVNGELDPQRARVQEVYRDYGWPSADFDKEACMKKVEQADEA
ncbi:uncharacterized protein RCC_04111 [Lecanosticta acicola]|uniref:cellulose 1,4-beta-cellobiosidase (non-reducing end) n=1 Tax=Lecanosticta acicola TaxID=111012 RepID=A0AAI8Z6N3_9PEZI|nr:uncharacterized protein RCC_04111 [Lecanosticta acicola]